MRFYLGTHIPSWLTRPEAPTLFVSRRRLARRKGVPQAVVPWSLDSGGFSELRLYGEWRTTPGEYVRDVARYRDEIGRLEWAAPQDWMCEEVMLARTGLTVGEHQRRTLTNYLELRTLDATLPFVPVLQGQTLGDYRRHADAYLAAGVDLAASPVVGVGSVCRRQATDEIVDIVMGLAVVDGLALHGFGMKTLGLAKVGHLLASADSMAWCMAGSRRAGCSPSHKNESNCYRWALEWRAGVVAAVSSHDPIWQPAMW